MSILHIRDGETVYICEEVSKNKYCLPNNINIETLKASCLYINVDGHEIINNINLFTFKKVNIEKLEDGSSFIVSNTSIPFIYDNCVTVDMKEKRENKNVIIRILLNPNNGMKVKIREEVWKKMYFYRIVRRIEIGLAVIIIIFLFGLLMFGLYRFRNIIVPSLKSVYRLPF